MAERVAVIGAGQMGNGIAHVFAQSGFDVAMIDVSADALERGRNTIGANLDRQIKKGTLQAADKDAILGRIATEQSVAAVDGASLIVEAATENRDLKFKIFSDIDAAAGASAILATNTSSISITEIAARTKRPDKVIGMHFMNPVPMMPLIEIVRGLATTEETYKTTNELAESLGKTPVTVNDFPGFVSNRVLMPMINEAVYCVMEGVGEAEAIDSIMKLGMGHPMGPLTLADLIGLDVCLDIMEVLQSGLGDSKYRPCPLLRKMVDAGHLGKKSGQGFYKY